MISVSTKGDRIKINIINRNIPEPKLVSLEYMCLILSNANTQYQCINVTAKVAIPEMHQSNLENETPLMPRAAKRAQVKLPLFSVFVLSLLADHHIQHGESSKSETEANKAGK